MNMRKDRQKNEILLFSKGWIILFLHQTTMPSKMKKSVIVSFPTKLNLSFFVPRVESYTFMVLLNAVKLLRTPSRIEYLLFMPVRNSEQTHTYRITRKQNNIILRE